MNDIELEKLGVRADKTTLKPNRYWCSVTETEMNIAKGTTAEQIVMKIFEQGYLQGIEKGKSKRSQEFKDLLNNKDSF